LKRALPSHASWSALSLTDAVSLKPSAKTRDYIYVETNIKIPTAIRSLALLPAPMPAATNSRSPFLTGGAGTQDAGISLGPEDSESGHHYQPDHTLLFA